MISNNAQVFYIHKKHYKQFIILSQIFFEVQKQDEETKQKLMLYRSEVQKWNQKIIFRHFSLQSTDMFANVEFICYFRDSKTPRGILGKFETNYELLKNGKNVDNTYFVITFNIITNLKINRYF